MNSIRHVPSRMKIKMSETSLGEERDRFDKQQVSLIQQLKGLKYANILSASKREVYVFDKDQGEISGVMLPKKVIVKKP